MERYLNIEVRHDVDRAELESRIARFSEDCPDRIPVLIEVNQRAGAPGVQDCLGWLRSQDVPCWYVEDGLTLKFAPKSAYFRGEFEDMFAQWITVIGPRPYWG